MRSKFTNALEFFKESCQQCGVSLAGIICTCKDVDWVEKAYLEQSASFSRVCFVEYLRRTQVMACSNNVVRAALTPKFRDVNLLVEMLTYNMGAPAVLPAESVDACRKRYTPPINDFEIQTLQVCVVGGWVYCHVICSARQSTPFGTTCGERVQRVTLELFSCIGIVLVWCERRGRGGGVMLSARAAV